MIIVVASQHGAGKSTAVDGLLLKFPELRKLEMGKKFRELAEKRGMNIDTFSLFLHDNPEESDRVDREMDDYQKEEVSKGDILVDSNLGAMVAPNADLKVLLICDAKVRAERVLRGGKRYGDDDAKGIEEMAKQLDERDKNDSERYQRLYRFDMFDKKNYDIVIDTAKDTKEGVVKRITEAL